MNKIGYQLDKAELRRSLLKYRKSMALEEWKDKSDRICHNLQTSALFTQAKTILAYFSFRQEPDLSPLFSDAKYCWGFPRCIGNALSWHIVETRNSASLQTGAYGIIEPHPEAPSIDPDEVDLILVPAVGCDHQAYRLGYGGGYYDRLFSSPEWAKKPTIGIVFEFGYLPQLPIELWDKPLQAVCTEFRLEMMR